MARIIKISLVLSGDENAVEYHRALPASYFDGCKIDLFTEEIESLRTEAKAKNPGLVGAEEYIRIAAIDPETGETFPHPEKKE